MSTGQEWVDTGRKWVSTGYSTTQGIAGNGGSNYFSGDAIESSAINGARTGNGHLVITAIEPHNLMPELTLQTEVLQLKSHVAGYNTILLKGSAADEDDDSMVIKYYIKDIPEAQDREIQLDHEGNFEEELLLPSSMQEGMHELSIWALDSRNGESHRNVINIKLDTTKPEIKFNNITGEEVKVDGFIPDIMVTDESIIESVEMTLDGNSYNGGALQKSGLRTIAITAKDEVGNTNIEDITLTINKSPEILEPIVNQKINKYDILTFPINQHFVDEENDNFSVEIVGTKDSEVTGKVEGDNIVIEGLTQGSSTFTVTAKDQYSTSLPIEFTVGVDTRAPELSINNSQYAIVGDGDKFILNGTVVDGDKERVAVTGDLYGIEKTQVIGTTTGELDPWSFEWNSSELAVGVYRTVKVLAEDTHNGNHELKWEEPIIRVSGDRSDYMTILNEYSKDIGKSLRDFSAEEHESILVAYESMLAVEEDNSVENQEDAYAKVTLIQEGNIKTKYSTRIAEIAVEWLVENFDIAEVGDYLRANIQTVTEETLDYTNELGKDYLDDKTELKYVDVHLIANIAKNVIEAEKYNTLLDWVPVQTNVLMMASGNLQEALIAKADLFVFTKIEADTRLLNEELLVQYFFEDVNKENLEEYQIYLKDLADVKTERINRTDISLMLTDVDKTEQILAQFLDLPDNEKLKEWSTQVDGLSEGIYKETHLEQLFAYRLLAFLSTPLEQEAEDYEALGLDMKPGRTPIYNRANYRHIEDKGIPNMTISILQDIINVSDTLVEYKGNTSFSNLEDVMKDLSKIETDSSFYEVTLEDIRKFILEHINLNLTKFKKQELVYLGIENLGDRTEEEYRKMLQDYSKSMEPLPQEEIQKAVDSVNLTEEAKTDPTTENINKGYDTVNTLVDGQFKADLLKELEHLVTGNIVENPQDVSIEDLESVGIEGLDPNNLEDYRLYLEDVASRVTPMGIADIQDIVDTVNELIAFYKTVEDDSTEINITNFSDKLNTLMSGNFKNKYKGYLPELALKNIMKHPGEQEVQVYTWTELEFEEDNLDSYNSMILTYVEDLEIGSMTLSKMQNFLYAVDSYVKSMVSSNIEEILKSMETVSQLEESKLREQLAKDLNKQLSKTINNKLGEATAEDLENIGIENVNPDYEDEYRDALKDLKNEKAPEGLTLEDIQIVIDAVNAVKKAEDTKAKEDITEAYKKVNPLPDGTLKDKLLQRLHDIRIGNVIENPEDATVEDLEYAGIEEVNPGLQDEYQDALEGYVKPITLEDIQDIINLVNQAERTKLNLTTQDLTKLAELVEGLKASDTKETYTKIYNVYKLMYQFETSIPEGSLEDVNNLIAQTNTQSKGYMERMTNALGGVSQAIVEPSDETILNAQTITGSLESGEFKTRLQDRVGQASLEYVLGNPEEATMEDYIKAGFEGITEDNFDRIKDAILDMIDELGPLTKEQIQDIINAIVAVERAEAEPIEGSLNSADEAIAKLADSRVKSGLEEIMKELWREFNTIPATPIEPIQMGEVSVAYVDQAGNEIEETIVLKKQVGKNYSTEQKDIAGYNFVSATGEVEGEATSETINVVYTYKKKPTGGGGGGGSPAPETPVQDELEPLPEKMPSTMMGGQSQTASIVVEVDKNKVVEDEDVKVKFKIQSLKSISNAKLVLYAKEDSEPEARIASVSTASIASVNNGEAIFEVSLDEILKGLFEDSKEFSIPEKGVYELKAEFNDLTNPNHNIQTNSVEIEVTEKDIDRSNLAVSVMTTYDKTPVFSRKSDGTFKKEGTVAKGSNIGIYDTYKDYYKLTNGMYVEKGMGTVFVGQAEVREDTVDVYNPDGTKARTMNKDDVYTIYSHDGEKFTIGEGQWVKSEDVNAYIFGWIVLDEDMALYDKSGSESRTLNKGETYRIFAVDEDTLNLGGGYTVKKQEEKFKFIEREK